MEAKHGHRIHDMVLVRISLTKYIHIADFMKNRDVGWQLDKSSTGDKWKMMIKAAC